MIKIINILVVIAYFSILIFLALEEHRFSGKKRQQITWGLTLFLSIFFGLRDFGLDIEPYKVIFDELRSISFSEISPSTIFTPTIEPFFVLLISAIKTAHLNFQAFLFISAGISFFLIIKAIQENIKTPILCFLFFTLFFLFKAADAVRHFLAASMYLYALHLLARDRPLRGYLLIVFSCLAHYANLITLIVSPFLKIRWRIQTYIFATLAAMLTALLLGQYLNSATSGQDVYLLWKLNYYLNNEDLIEYQNNLHRILLLSLVFFYYLSILAINLSALLNRKHFHFSKFEFLLLNSQIIGSLIATFFLSLGAFALATRTLLPLGIGCFFLLTQIWQDTNQKQKSPVSLYLIITILLSYNFLVILYNAGIHYYKSPFYLG